jgi:hypothetical protein
MHRRGAEAGLTEQRRHRSLYKGSAVTMVPIAVAVVPMGLVPTEVDPRTHLDVAPTAAIDPDLGGHRDGEPQEAHHEN